MSNRDVNHYIHAVTYVVYIYVYVRVREYELCVCFAMLIFEKAALILQSRIHYYW